MEGQTRTPVGPYRISWPDGTIKVEATRADIEAMGLELEGATIQRDYLVTDEVLYCFKDGRIVVDG